MSDQLTVHSFFFYLTEIEGITWRNEDYAANKIIKTVKGDKVNGTFSMNIDGQVKTFNQRNCEDFLPPLFGEVAEQMKKTIKGDFAIVPIPNSKAVVGDKSEFRTLAHARAIAAAIGSRAKAVPALRWKKEKLSARKGGTRDPQVHFDNLSVVVKPDRPVVLFDDVITTGGQMIGAARRLAKAGLPPVCGFVIGRSTKEQKASMLGWTEHELAVHESPLDWPF